MEGLCVFENYCQTYFWWKELFFNKQSFLLKVMNYFLNLVI